MSCDVMELEIKTREDADILLSEENNLKTINISSVMSTMHTLWPQFQSNSAYYKTYSCGFYGFIQRGRTERYDSGKPRRCGAITLPSRYVYCTTERHAGDLH